MTLKCLLTITVANNWLPLVTYKVGSHLKSVTYVILVLYPDEDAGRVAVYVELASACMVLVIFTQLKINFLCE